MSEFKLTVEDLNVIAKNEREIGLIVNRIDKLRTFKLGDYVIAFQVSFDTKQKVPVCNTYGVPIKYQVVHVDKNGIPYVKHLNTKAKSSVSVSGNIIPMIGRDEDSRWGRHGYSDFDFELDPEFVDSIILEEEKFNALEKHMSVRNLRKEITDHNKKVKFDLSTIEGAVKALDTMEIGHTYWISIKSGFTVNHIDIVALNYGDRSFRTRTGSTYNYPKNMKAVKRIHVTRSNGEKETIYPHQLMYTNLYFEMPRSYKELSEKI